MPEIRTQDENVTKKKTDRLKNIDNVCPYFSWNLKKRQARNERGKWEAYQIQ